MDIGKEIRKIREEKGLTQSYVAASIGLDNSSYARIEKKGNKLPVEQLVKIANVLEVSVNELLTGYPQVEQASQQTQELKKKVEEQDAIIQLIKTDRDRLSDFFLMQMKEITRSIIITKLIWTHQPLFSETGFETAKEMVNLVTLRQNNTDKYLCTISAHNALFYHFILSMKALIKEEYQQTSQLISAYIDCLKYPEKYNNNSVILKLKYGIYDDDIKQLTNIERLSQSLTSEQEQLVNEVQELLEGLTVNEINATIEIKPDAWPLAYRFAIEQLRKQNTRNGNLLTPILLSGVILDEEFINATKKY